MEEKPDFKPFVPADRVAPEFTVVSLLLGCLLAVLFGGANAYLGLRVGMTVSASIPAAVISMGIIRVLLRRDSILENNMVQTIGSAGESVAAGAIFTLPAMFMWMKEWGGSAPSLVEISMIALCGGVLGVLFMVPLRKALIVREHGVLPYPEGTACAEVLLAGEQGGSKAGTVFAGLGLAALYKFIADGLKLFPSEVHYEIGSYRGAGVGVDVLPALLGVGYICGPRIASYMMAGGVVSWLVLMPLIALFGGDVLLFPGLKPISEMASTDIWNSYIKYIGAGAVAAGGILSLVKSLPLIVRTFGQAVKGYGGEKGSGLRTDRDLPMGVIGALVLITIVFIWLFPPIPVTLLGAVCIAVFGFFFATVSSRLVGLVGSSNNPVSGMAIATLLFCTMLLKSTGSAGQGGMMGAIAIGSVICIIAAIAGDTSQDLKTGYILGATPRKQQLGELVGVAAAALAIGGVLYLLDMAWGYGSTELPAPQAMLMKMVVEGVMEGNLPWTLVFAGAGIGAAAEILRIPVLPFAVGIYLPIHLSVPIMTGGLVRLWFEKRRCRSEEARRDTVERGVLYTSGMIAGEGLVGILLAVFAIIPVGKDAAGEAVSLGTAIDLSRLTSGLGGWAALLSLAAFGLLILSLLGAALRNRHDAA